MPNTNYGYVYLLTNPAMPGMVKIGMTHRDELDVRLKELYPTGVPLPFECEYACKVPHDKCEALEHALHVAFDPYRVNPNREFFNIIPEQAIAIMEFFDVEEVTEEVQQEIDNDTDDADKIAVTKAKSKRPPLNYIEMGLNIGDVLQWKDDPSISVKVYSERKVEYNGEIWSLSPLSAKLLGSSRNVAPCAYWCFGDKSLDEIYNETYPFNE